MKIALVTIILGLIATLLVGAINLAGGCSGEVNTVGMATTIPPLDLNKPEVTEIATFALG